MADDTQLLYLEPDDEITTVVRRLREADGPRVVLVASGRTKATTSVVALRLLAQVAADERRQVALVADAAARSLAAEAGIPAFASVADAMAPDAVPLEAPAAQRAPIHVVRGEAEPAAPEMAAGRAMGPSGMEETQAVPVQERQARYPVPAQRSVAAAAQPRARAAATRRSPARWLLPALVLLLLAGVGAALGTVVPAATVVIRPQAVSVGPLSYTVQPQVRTSSSPQLSSTKQGEATGHRTKRTAATGEILIINYSPDNVFVPMGTVVSVNGEVFFHTTQAVTVPDSGFFFPGTASVAVEAVDKGPVGNVPALAIDRIEDKDVDRALRGGGNDRRVRNDQPTSGGEEQQLLVVRKSDVTAVSDAIRADLAQQLTTQRQESGEDRIYPSGAGPKVEIDVPKGLQGHASADPYPFELTGTLTDDQAYVLRSDVTQAATSQASGDPAAVPAGTALEADSIAVDIGDATVDGDRIAVSVQVRAQAVPQYDEASIGSRIAGMTAASAEAELSAIGRTTVSLWPFWVDRVPRLDWRVTVDVRPVEQPTP
jgi:hypothetical protein